MTVTRELVSPGVERIVARAVVAGCEVEVTLIADVGMTLLEELELRPAVVHPVLIKGRYVGVHLTPAFYEYRLRRPDSHEPVALMRQRALW